MSKNPVTVALGPVAEGVDGKIEADLLVTYHDNRACTVACIADDELTALSLRTLVRQRLELGGMSSVYDRIEQLEEEAESLSALVKEQDAALAKAETKKPDFGMSDDWPLYDNIPGSMDPSCSTIGIDSHA